MAARASKPITIVHLLLLCTLVSVDLDAEDRLPRSGTIVAGQDLRRHVNAMRERSPTFRDQWDRLEAARVFVRIRRSPQLPERSYEARTIIKRMIDGALVASVEIGACGDPTEWLAHELEHILEQVEGIDLGRLARTRSGAWSSGNAFETERAIRVGRAVRREMHNRLRASVSRLQEPASDDGLKAAGVK